MRRRKNKNSSSSVLNQEAPIQKKKSEVHPKYGNLALNMIEIEGSDYEAVATPNSQMKTPKSKLFPPKNINIETEKQFHAMQFLNDYSYVNFNPFK